MTQVGKRWLIFGVIAIVGLIAAMVIFSNSDTSPRSFIDKTYTRDTNPTVETSSNTKVYTSSKSPSVVADEIEDAATPHSTKDSEGHYFLQYRDEIVAVIPDGGGSIIEVDDYEEGYRRHSSTFIFFGGFGWSSYRPSSGYRGGGFGSGGK